MPAELSPGQLTARHTRDEPTRSADLPQPASGSTASQHRQAGRQVGRAAGKVLPSGEGAKGQTGMCGWLAGRPSTGMTHPKTRIDS